MEFTSSAARFLMAAEPYLRAHPVIENVAATVAHRAVREDAEGVVRPPARPWWFAVVRDPSGAVVGIAMRTAPGPDYAIWVGGMPAGAARPLADLLSGRGEAVVLINGARHAAEALAGRFAERSGCHATVRERTRLFELGELVQPAGVSGTLRSAEPQDFDLVQRWWTSFLPEAAEQAGRIVSGTADHDPQDICRRIRDRQVWLWEDRGEVVHMTAAHPPSGGVSRIGPVYTPKPYRGRGYAIAAVAGVSGTLLDRGARVCLFTDQANPISNRIYQRIGFRPVVDMVQLAIIE